MGEAGEFQGLGWRARRRNTFTAFEPGAAKGRCGSRERKKRGKGRVGFLGLAWRIRPTNTFELDTHTHTHSHAHTHTHTYTHAHTHTLVWYTGARHLCSSLVWKVGVEDHI